jgi:drug/metabolite transporter (DMT)-like permease
MLVVSVLMTVVASTLLKIGGRAVNFEGGIMAIAIGYMTTPLIITGFAFYALAAFIWIYCLSQFDLSYVTFVSSIQYIFMILVSIMIFHEQISAMKWAGCVFIMIGVILWLRG